MMPGHTVGTHSENHPFQFGNLPPDRMATEIDDGIAHVSAALGDPSLLAPFFRIPGLRRSEAVEAALGSRGIMNWSADFPADDWRHISSGQVVHFALSRLEAKGKGVLLLHDIQARTQAALPVILRELKARGYRIVHVVPATPERPKTVTDPAQWVPYWIHGPNIAVKAPSGFTFGAVETPFHDAPRSVRSVWLARQKVVARTSVVLLQPTATAPLLGKPARTNISAASRQRSLVRLPGSHPVRACDGAIQTPHRADQDRQPDRCAGPVRISAECMIFGEMVRSEGLEPPPCYGLPPQGSASTNSATSARRSAPDSHPARDQPAPM